MPSPGDLCLLQDFKAYMGGASSIDTTNDDLFEELITAASAFVARYLDRDLMSLGGQGLGTIASVGSDSGGAFVALESPLSTTPAAGTPVTDVVSGAKSQVGQPAGASSNAAARVYLVSTANFAAGDAIRFTYLQQYIETLDGTGKPWLWVRQWPIGAVVTVVDVTSGTALALDRIAFDSDIPRLVFRTPSSSSTPVPLVTASGLSSGTVFPRGIQNVQVTYAGGYASTPPDLAQATIETTLAWFKKRDRLGVAQQSVLGTRVSFVNDAEMLPETCVKLNPYRRTISGI